MTQDINDTQRQRAAERLMIHLQQKGRPASYKKRLIDGFANPDTGGMPQALTPIVGNGPLGALQRVVLKIEDWIRSRSDEDRVSYSNQATSLYYRAKFYKDG